MQPGEPFISRSLEDTARFAEALLARIPEAGDKPAVILLSGDLGSGKTALVQEMVKILHPGMTVTSPTYVIAKRYAISYRGYVTFIHMDLYRIEDQAELATTGWDSFLAEADAVIAVEWPERLPALPERAHRVLCATPGEGEHIYTYEAP
jgi:tRNA threonylcarbamoyladenosine biosynthesis protein TsaE